MSAGRYALISACRNEEQYLDTLVDCVASQTVRPSIWVVVDDGSTDGTYQKACIAARQLSFLRVVRMPATSNRSFASQAYAANHGYQTISGESFDHVGFLDADIRFCPDYYEELIARLAEDSRLGLCGGRVIDVYANRRLNPRAGSEDYHVAGGVQLFRREAFEKIGGYTPIEGGGQDTIADVMVMMNGWTVRTFSDLDVDHLRPGGSVGLTSMQRGMDWGRKFYRLGYHPLFYTFQCLRRISQPPILLGSLLNGVGFVAATLRNEPRPVSEKFVRFQRRMQLQRIRNALGLGRHDNASARPE